MGGKASLVLVLGFSVLFLIAGQKFGEIRSSVTDNTAEYYHSQKAEVIASTAMQNALSEISCNYDDPSKYNASLAGFKSGCDYMGGKVNINIAEVMFVIDKIKYTTAKGILLTARGEYGNAVSISEVKFKLADFSSFAYLSNNEGSNIWWTSRDTITGKFHTNDELRISSHPNFLGDKTTYSGSLIYYKDKKTDYPNLGKGVFSQSSKIEWPPKKGIDDFEIAASGGKIFSGQPTVFITFMGDSLEYKFSEFGKTTKVKTSEFAPNGRIFVKNGALLIKGVVKGNIVVGASGTAAYKTGDMSQSSSGNVFITGNLTYSDIPDWTTGKNAKGETPEDVLGIMAEQNVLIEKNSLTQSLTDLHIHATIYCENGGFGVEDYQNYKASKGHIKLRGGVQQNIRRAVGQFGFDKRGNQYNTSGLSKDYMFDQRLSLMSPNFFPSTDKFDILSAMSYTRIKKHE